MTWEEAARFVENEGEEVDWDGRFFICPHCQEPVYEDDYPQLDLWADVPVCPVCENIL